MLAFFSPILYGLKRRYDLKEKQLQAAPETRLLTDGSDDSEELAEVREHNRLLQERIENLEAIVCSVDYELNARLAKLPSQPVARIATAPAGNPGEPTPAALPAAAAVNGGTHTDIARGPARAASAPPAELQVGEVMGNRYRIERLLGRGGMGAVFQAHDEVLGESVALKVIAMSWNADAKSMLDRFRREASTARKVSSPNVIRIHDIGEMAGGQAYISMEYFPGKPLSELLTARGTLDSDDGRDILAQVCDGLSAAHKAGVVHRDLKPQNILVGPRNAVKIIDFGLAKSSFMPELTATGLIMGTPHYMSPEQVRGRQVDARSDIYALGAVTYHAMTGRPPFEGKTPIAIGFAHCSEQPVPPVQLRPSLSSALSDMILSALAKKPSDRPQSADEFRAAIEA